MKTSALLSAVYTAGTVAALPQTLPPLLNITDIVVSPENSRAGPKVLATNPDFCHYDIWEYSTWDCTGDDYSTRQRIQSTDCYTSRKSPNHCLWIRPLDGKRCAYDNTAWFYKSFIVGCNEHHKFEAKFDGEIRLNLHHPWDSMILNK